MAYMSLEEVEFLHDGQQAQQREQAADPKQQARPPTERRAPMMTKRKYQKITSSNKFASFLLFDLLLSLALLLSCRKKAQYANSRR